MNELARVVPLNDISGAAHDDHLISMWLSGRSKHTKRGYQSDIARFRNHVAKPIRFVTAADIVGYSESLDKLAPSSQHRMLSTVKSLFSYARRLGYVSLDPAAALRLPKLQDDIGAKIISRETVLALIESASGRDRVMVTTLYLCGLREAELIGLKTGDLRTTNNGWALTVTGKGNRIRHVAIPPELAGEIRSLGNGPFQDKPIFRSVNGNALSASDVYRLVRRLGDSIGYRITPHMLRHSHVSHALDMGAPIHLVRETVGHSSLKTTSIYAHSKPSDSSALFLTSKSKDGRTI